MNKEFSGKITDFIIISFLFFSVSASVFGVYKLLYTEQVSFESITLITEELDTSYRELLHVGDTIYDTLTKRTVGEISELEILDTGAGIRFKIGLIANRFPRGEALRTRDLWFRYSKL